MIKQKKCVNTLHPSLSAVASSTANFKVLGGKMRASQTKPSIPEVWDKMTTEEKNEDEICSISGRLPLIPVRSNTKNLAQNYDLLPFLRWIDQKSTNPLNVNEKITLETFGSKYALNRELIDKFDYDLKKYSYTREDFLAYCKISPELYAQLLTLDFHLPESLNFIKKIKNFFNNNPEAIPIINITCILILFVLYRQMFLTDICINSSELHQDLYNFIHKAILITYPPSHENKFGPSHCMSLFKGLRFNIKGFNFNYNHLPTSYLNGSLIGLNSEELFFLTTSGRIKELNNAILITALGCAVILSSYILLTIIKEFIEVSDDEKLKINLTWGIFTLITVFLGIYLITNNSDFSKLSYLNTLARACNDAFLLPRLANKTDIPPELSEALVLPTCSTPFLNETTAGVSMLAGPISFFGSQFIRYCRKKLNNSNSVENQFAELRERNFAYE